MCIFGGGGGSAPQPQPLPPVPPPLPTIQDPEVKRARRETRRRALAAAGRTSSIVTSGLGLSTPASTTRKTLLGR